MWEKFCECIRKKKGTAVLETALCIPVLLYLVFFTLEIVRIEIYQVAIDNMVLQLAFEYSGRKNSSNFKKIVKALKPPFFKSMNNVNCHIHVFSDLTKLMKSNATRGDPEWENQLSSDLLYDTGINTTTSGCAFMITVSYKYPFTSAFVEKLFTGGKKYNNNFLLWGRAINVCN